MTKAPEQSKKTRSGDTMRVRVLQKAAEVARQEVSVAIPAAKLAVSHGVQAFLKKFSEEYTKERKKQRGRR